MFKDLLNDLEEFESEMAHVIGDIRRASRISHMIRNRVGMCTDIVKYNYNTSVERGEISEDEANIAIEVMRSFDKIFFSLDDNSVCD